MITLDKAENLHMFNGVSEKLVLPVCTYYELQPKGQIVKYEHSSAIDSRLFSILTRGPLVLYRSPKC